MSLNLTNITTILGQIPALLAPVPNIMMAIAEIAIYAAAITLSVGIVYAVLKMVQNSLRLKGM